MSEINNMTFLRRPASSELKVVSTRSVTSPAHAGLTKFVATLTEGCDRSRAFHAFQGYLGDFGIRDALYAHSDSTGAATLLASSRGLEHLLSSTGVRQIAEAEGLPVRWADGNAAPSASTELRTLMRRAAAITLPAGLVIPLHGPRGRVAVFAAFGAAAAIGELTAYDIAALLAAATHFNFLVANSSKTTDQRLSSRELEVLERSAQGHTAQVIAQALKIAEVTVKFHLKNARRKLGATNTREATTMAALLGLLVERRQTEHLHLGVDEVAA
jgi:DNA-binding CsgD family transcriptional regulator